jgi:hypothetical protein
MAPVAHACGSSGRVMILSDKLGGSHASSPGAIEGGIALTEM